MDLDPGTWAQLQATEKPGTNAAMPEGPSRSVSLPKQMAPGVEFLGRAAGQLRAAAAGSPGTTTSTDYTPSDRNTVWPEKWGPERLYGSFKLDEHISREAMAGGYAVHPMHAELPASSAMAKASLKLPGTAEELPGRSVSLATSASAVDAATDMSSVWPDQWGHGKPQNPIRLRNQGSHSGAMLSSWRAASGSEECTPESAAAAWTSYALDSQHFEQMPMPNLPANGPAQQRAAASRLGMHDGQRWSSPSASGIRQAMMDPVATAAMVPWRADMAAGKESLLPLGPIPGARRELDSAAGMGGRLAAEAAPGSAAKPSLLHLGLAGSALPWQHGSAAASHGGRAAPVADVRTGAAGGSVPWQGIGPPPAMGSLLPGTWNVDGIFEPHWSHVQGRKAAQSSAGSGMAGGPSPPWKHPCDDLFHRQTQQEGQDPMRPGPREWSSLSWPGQGVVQPSMPRLEAGLQLPQLSPQGSSPWMAQSSRRPLQRAVPAAARRDEQPGPYAQLPGSSARLPSKVGTGGVALTPTTAGEQMNAHDSTRRKWAPGATMQVLSLASCIIMLQLAIASLAADVVYQAVHSSDLTAWTFSVEVAAAGLMLWMSLLSWLRRLGFRTSQA